MPEDMGMSFGAQLIEEGEEVAADERGRTTSAEDADKGLRVKRNTWS